ncbi:MAG: branched-chain amino acid aminotransferase [Flavobacteriales bacterium]|nr:branched-chain amino acid aminotransferase [Flavobacteriales bacterium]
MTVDRIAESRIKEIDFSNIPFGKQFSDHMLVMDYANGVWSSPHVMPYGNMPISPACLGLHYGQTIFEGLKAYRQNNGEIVLFRPADNFARLNISAERMCMPTIPVDTLVECLRELVHIDQNWVPKTHNASLYIRPFMYATDEAIGVRPSETYRFIIITGPVGPYYSVPLKVLVETHYTRAAAGGTGSAKAGGNYGGALLPTRAAQQKGYHQLIWTDAKQHRFVEESGTMNVMFQIGDSLLTPSTGDTILQGITRDSVLTLARSLGIDVQERPISVEEVVAAHHNGTLKDAFGVGTAATIAPIELIGHEGEDLVLPPIEDRQLSKALAAKLTAIRYGDAEDTFGWTVKVG